MSEFVSKADELPDEAASRLSDRLGAKREVINFLAFFSLVLNGGIQLSNTQDATVIASWKVGGQDFYIYGRRA